MRRRTRPIIAPPHCSSHLRAGSRRLHAGCWRPMRTRTRPCMMAAPRCSWRLRTGSRRLHVCCWRPIRTRGSSMQTRTKPCRVAPHLGIPFSIPAQNGHRELARALQESDTYQNKRRRYRGCGTAFGVFACLLPECRKIRVTLMLMLPLSGQDIFCWRQRQLSAVLVLLHVSAVSGSLTNILIIDTDTTHHFRNLGLLNLKLAGPMNPLTLPSSFLGCCRYACC